ncbi:MAG: beta-ketoacyl-[acyl-carrier-protein] synthase family protein [Propionibacteriaceae bacterium]
MKTVVITGMGTLNPLGATVSQTWDSLLAGRSGAVELTADWAADLPSRIAAPVLADLSTRLDRVLIRKLDRSSQLALFAAHEAWEDAGLTQSAVDPERVAVSVGIGMGGLQTVVEQWDLWKEKGSRRVSPHTVPMLMSNAPAAQIGLLIGARAGVHAPVSACASSNEALAHGADLIRLNRADIVMAGGTEAVVHPLAMAAFGSMRALSRRNDNPAVASRPWDIGRDGFVLAEGAALLVLESLEHAQARGARILGTLAGSGISDDDHDIVQPEPTGRGQVSAMTKALHDAKLSPRDICHVNAHATSTPQGDTTEAHSIQQALASNIDNVVVTSTKSMTGHLLGAAGALEAIATVMSLRHRCVPATINIDELEPGLGIDIAHQQRDLAQSGDLAAINNSFGFGGHNVAVIFSNQHLTHTA